MGAVADDFPVPLAVGNWLRQPARHRPTHPAIISGERSVDYATLDAWSDRLARVLVGRGLGLGDRVATLSENSVEQVVLLFACARAGLILAPLNWHLSPDELAVQLDLFAPALTLVAASRWSEQAGGVVAGWQPEPLEDYVTDAYPAAGTSLPAIDDDAGLLLIATSGTTGVPKGALLTNRNCYWTNASLQAAMPLDADDVVLGLLPQYHVGGWNIQTLLAWSLGATVVLERSFDPGRVLELIERHRVTTLMGVPTTYVLVAEHPRFADTDLSSLRFALVGGAAMPRSAQDRWAERGVAMAVGYGLTEAGPNALVLPPGEAPPWPGAVGRPYPYVEVALRDPTDGRVLAGAGTGEILVRGPNVFAGYWRAPAATGAAMVEGWLRTGDIGERDAQGNYRISGRTKEMFISGGENVFPAEVERVLSEHPAIADAAVIGVPDPVWGEVGVAYVVTRRDAVIGVDELEAHCRAHLARYKVPRRIVITAELPRSPVGKVDKRYLPRDVDVR